MLSPAALIGAQFSLPTAHEHAQDGESHVHLHLHHAPAEHQTPEAHPHSPAAPLGIGTLHGLAGSSHFLGVLPALAFSSKAQTTTYLLTFGVGTVAAMAVGGFWLATSFRRRTAAAGARKSWPVKKRAG